ncbi:hypothetical protein ESZ48_17470 [Gelidibacter gilvus]|uniref:Uncharacterized protein n=2 Tax=Gelidibacter gilvus TaxID=59602 RepID=A0A4Q0XEV2_9FLAO|nr:hypothetical protein ESZ48_17470 [Gelidibacter gilvus]
MISMSAQVGVNNPTPEQALDVNGKVKITNDDTAPTAGTMRYDATSSDFEGYNGSQWNSFTQSRSSGLPSNPVPIHGFSDTSSANGGRSSIEFRRWDNPLSVFTDVPSGKYLIITSIDFHAGSYAEDNAIYSVQVQPLNPTGIPNFYSDGGMWLSSKGDLNAMSRSSAQSPLFILSPEQRFSVANSTSYPIYMSVRGFIVDDLNY